MKINKRLKKQTQNYFYYQLYKIEILTNSHLKIFFLSSINIKLNLKTLFKICRYFSFNIPYISTAKLIKYNIFKIYTK